MIWPPPDAPSLPPGAEDCLTLLTSTTAKVARPSHIRKRPTGDDAPPPSRLLASLDAATTRSPNARKRLIGPDVNYGRELLVALARLRGGWIGWEATNLRGIAEQLAFAPLARVGRRAGGDIEIGALANAALDAAIATEKLDKRFVALQGSIGFRHAVRDSLLALRVARVSAGELRSAARPGAPAYELASVVEHFERLLAESNLVDPAGVFHVALEAFDIEAPFVLDGELFLAPGLTAHGLPSDLLERLIAHGATRLDSDEALGNAAETRQHERTINFFAAATRSDELREVLRRATSEGYRVDEIEIVTTDPDTHGIALDALCQRLGTGATMLQGIPLARTRLGRAIERWMAWLSDGLPADILREALEAGEIELQNSDLPASALARELRRLQVGWGRSRYEAAIKTLAAKPALNPYDDESDEDFTARQASRHRTMGTLQAFLVQLLDATPIVPERGSDRPVHTSAPKLASMMLRWMQLVPRRGMAEDQTAARIESRLTELAAITEPDVGFSAAIAGLRDVLADVRAWPLVTEERKPWSASGGMVHLTDIAHAGTTGRPRTFVVGLDADRAGGTRRQDPLLIDTVRAAVAPGRLPTTRERRDEYDVQLNRALAGLRGRVTLSYSTSGSLDGREAGPSPVLLEWWRHAQGDQSLTYEKLRDELRPPKSAVPGDLEASIDARDAWLAVVADGPLLLDGTDLVRECFPMLDAGLASIDAAAQPVAGPHHGIVLDAIGEFDLVGAESSISPSSLELLGKCPLAWFYRHALGLRPPSDPEYNPDAWLDNMDRGSLLHEIYESIATRYRGRQADIASADARAVAIEITNDVIGRWREKVPPPGETVFEAESAELRAAAISFVEMERELVKRGDAAEWIELELAFGKDGKPGSYQLGGGGTLGIHGRIDRVDQLPDGSLRVVDYKTGKSNRFQKSPKKPPFDGGRQLQPAIYAAAVEALTAKKVSRFEYRFPTARGESEIVGYDAAELRAAAPIVSALLEQAASGAFPPTTDADDCRYCDCSPICRARQDGFKTTSPRAEWAKTNAGTLDVYQIMRALRAIDGAAGDEV